jgi:magnesium transporter
MTRNELHEIWEELSEEERIQRFKELSYTDAPDFFLKLESADKSAIIMAADPAERKLWLRLLDPDDAADVIQETPEEHRGELLDLLDLPARNLVTALMAYAEDVAGGLMNPRFVRARPDMTVAQALRYVRRQALHKAETIYYVYVLGTHQELLGVMSLRELFTAQPDAITKDLMHSDVISVTEETDQEELGHLFADHNFLAIPVVDDQGHMKGIVTVDDIVDVVEEEATEDIQKIGGVEALDAPYLRISMAEMIRKRAGWLTILFVGELLTATAMGYFENQIARAVVLALFVPLIISSGGNAGSQASTLVIRAMALGEIHLRDWWRVVRREIIGGLALGGILGLIGFLRVIIWQLLWHAYGDHYLLLAATVFISLIGVVLWGSVTGSVLPLILRRIGFDPASASTPFVATLVDVTGLVIYFSVASVLLRGTLL